MMQQLVWLVGAVALLSMTLNSSVMAQEAGSQVIADDDIQNDVELDLMDDLRDQEHVDSDPICSLIIPVDGEVPDDYRYFLNSTENERCNNANDDEEEFGDCWCPGGMSCGTEGVLEDHEEHFCILTATLVSQEEQREDFGDGLLLGGGGSPEIIVSTIDEENDVVDEVEVETDV